MNVVYVFIGGGLGCVLRYVFSVLFNKYEFFSFPWATLLSNVISCLVFAIAVAVLGERGAFSSSSTVRPLLLTGFCGGLSTFSTFSFESFELMKRGDYTTAGVNVLLNVILCFAIFAFFAKK